MDRRNIIGVLGGMTLGALIVLATLFLNARINAPLSTIEQAAQFVSERELSDESVLQLPPTGGKDLCAVLTQEEVNRLVPEAQIRTVERSPLVPFSNCAYFGDRRSVPLISFNHNLADLQSLKAAQRNGGASLKDLSGIGDGAFFASVPSLPGSDLNLRVIFFRIGNFGYSISSFDLSENQLKVLATAAVPKLR